MRDLGVQKPVGRSRETGGVRHAPAGPPAAELSVNTPQQQREAALLLGDSGLFRFRKVWQAPDRDSSTAAANATEAKATAAAAQEERGSSHLGAMLQHEQMSCVGPTPYSSAFSRLTASLSKAAVPAAAAATRPGEDQSVSPSAGAQQLKVQGPTAVVGGEPSQKSTAASLLGVPFHYKGTPSSGRLLPLGRLHAHDPTLEGRIEAFIAECCDAGGSIDKPDGSTVSAAAEQACVRASAGSWTDDDTAAVRNEEQQYKRTQQWPQRRQQLRVTAAVGTLTGKYTGWKICLPVALPAMLEEQAEAHVKFEEALGEIYAVAAYPQGSSGVEGPVTGKDGKKDGLQQSPLLQQLLQRLLEARRQAYELLPAKRVYEVVERRGSRGTAGGQRLLQTMEEQDEEEAGFGGARVLRYRLLDAPVSLLAQGRRSNAAAAAAGSGFNAGAQVESKGVEGADSSTKQTSDQETVVAGTATGESVVPKKQKPNARAGEGKTKINISEKECHFGSSPHPSERKTQQEQQRHIVQVVERVPLGCRFVYRPKSDRHIRLAAESEVLFSLRLPFLHHNPQKCAQQREHGEKDLQEDEGGQRGDFAEQLHLEEGDVKQRWWAVHDVWELQPRRLERSGKTPYQQGLPQHGMHQGESEQEVVLGDTGLEGPRWSVVVSEEGEIEDCSTDPVTLLLRRLANGNNRVAADLLKRCASGSSAANQTPAKTAAAAATTMEGLLGSAEDVDRYEETKRTSIQLIGCGLEMQQQRTRQRHLRKNVFGALALLLVENAQVLARWFDESFERAGARPTQAAGSGILYYPNHMGDAVHAVQRHYNQRKLISAGRSRVTGLRLHNNQVKRLLIYKYVERGQSVLELACGHGQDLWKYAERCISKFVGVDLSLSEIREARRRMREGDRAAQFMLQQMLRPPVFHVGNLVDSRALSFLKAEQFDIVSIQLAIHYMMETEKQARGVLTRAAAHLKEGGLLLGSTVCCDAIASRLLQLRRISPTALRRGDQGPAAAAAAERVGAAGEAADDGYEFGNDLYSVTFSKFMLRKLLEEYADPAIAEVTKRLLPKQDADAAAGLDGGSRSTDDESGALFGSVTSPAAQTALVEYLRDRLAREFGLAYHFYLADSIDAREFVLPWRSLCAIAASVGLKLVSSISFPEFLTAAAADPRCGRHLTKWLSTLPPSKLLDKPQFEAFSLYKIFVFKKVSQTTGARPTSFRDDVNSQGVSSSSNSRVLIPGGCSSSHVAGTAATTECSAGTATEYGSLSTPSMNGSSSFGASGNSTSSSSSGGSSSNLEEGVGCALETAGLVAAQVPGKLREGGTVIPAAPATAGGGAPGTEDKEAKTSVSSRFFEGVPIKRRRREGTQHL